MNTWAAKLTLEKSEELEQTSLKDLTALKSQLCYSYYACLWVRSNSDIFEKISENSKEILCLCFQELANENDSYQIAANCIAEVLYMSREQKVYNLQEFLKQNLLLLENKCQVICDDEDIEAIEIYASMFADLADNESDNIIKGQDTQILNICLVFYDVEGKHINQLNSFFQMFWSKIRKVDPSRVPFFKDFYEMLLESIGKKSKIPKDMFLDFDDKNEGHADFDELYKDREE